jgi:hypothetical protein
VPNKTYKGKREIKLNSEKKSKLMMYALFRMKKQRGEKVYSKVEQLWWQV